jgi:hypothetical protein
MAMLTTENFRDRRQSPTYHFFMANSSQVVIDNMSLISVSDNENANKNTDGIGRF